MARTKATPRSHPRFGSKTVARSSAKSSFRPSSGTEKKRYKPIKRRPKAPVEEQEESSGSDSDTDTEQHTRKKRKRIFIKSGTSSANIFNRVKRGKTHKSDKGNGTGRIGFFPNKYMEAALNQAVLALQKEGYAHVPYNAQRRTIIPYVQKAAMAQISPILADVTVRVLSKKQKTIGDSDVLAAYRAFCHHRPDLCSVQFNDADLMDFVESEQVRIEEKRHASKQTKRKTATAKRHRTTERKRYLDYKSGVLPFSRDRIIAINHTMIDDDMISPGAPRTRHTPWKRQLNTTARGKSALRFLFHHIVFSIFKVACTRASCRKTSWKTLKLTDVEYASETFGGFRVYGHMIPAPRKYGSGASTAEQQEAEDNDDDFDPALHADDENEEALLDQEDEEQQEENADAMDVDDDEEDEEEEEKTQSPLEETQPPTLEAETQLADE